MKNKNHIILFSFGGFDVSKLFSGGSSSSSAGSSSGGGGDMLGPIIDFSAGRYGQNTQNSANKREAQKQMDFQERMSSTAYRRASHDLEEAGINRILAGKFGAASTPQGAMASMGNSVKAGYDAMSSGASTEKTQADTAVSIVAKSLKEIETALKKTELPRKTIQKTVFTKALKVIQNFGALSNKDKKAVRDQMVPLFKMYSELFTSKTMSKGDFETMQQITGQSTPKKLKKKKTYSPPLGYQK